MSAAAFLPQYSLALGRTSDVSLHPFKIVHDTRFQGSLSLSQAMLDTLPQATPALLQPVNGDVGPFWYQQLSRQWAGQNTALVGVTGERVLFCLQQFARDRQMRVWWRQSHAESIIDPETGQHEQLVSWLIQ